MNRYIKTTEQDNILTVILNRPESLNALCKPMLVEILDIINKLDEHKYLRAIIFTGAGDRAFCAGADLKERQGMSELETYEFVKFIQLVFHKISQIKIPTIAAINSHAFGGGLELALACDLRIAGSNILLGLTECSLGIIPGAGGTQRLAHIVGRARALDLILGARKITGEQAYEYLLVEYLVKSHESVLDLASKIAHKISQNAPLAVRAAKHAVLHAHGELINTGLEIELEAYKNILSSKDRLEGLKAFSEKRPPRFLGC